MLAEIRPVLLPRRAVGEGLALHDRPPALLFGLARVAGPRGYTAVGDRGCAHCGYVNVMVTSVSPLPASGSQGVLPLKKQMWAKPRSEPSVTVEPARRMGPRSESKVFVGQNMGKT